MIVGRIAPQIVVSALFDDALAERGALPPEVPLFTKPVDRSRFVATIRERAAAPRTRSAI